MTKLPVVAVVGRANVGKSTLVNRIVGRRETIVEERPGVTRDRKVVEAEWTGRHFLLVDTGGWVPGGDERALDTKVSAQAERAWREADLILLVIDVNVGVTDQDLDAAAAVRRTGKPVLVAANKVDAETREERLWEATALGLGDPIAVSALHGRGSGDLLDEVVARLPEPTDEELDAIAAEEEKHAKVPAVAIVGRPNVGKSTLFNRLIGDERSIVHDLPGTTRDTIDTIVDTEQGPIRFVDTAGMRRRSRIDEGTEYYSLVRALQAIDAADVALLLIDATEGVTHQDQRLAERVEAAGCPVVVLLNKWELLDAEARRGVLRQMADRLRFLEHAPVLKVSALSAKGVHRVGPAMGQAIEAYRSRVPTAELNRVIRAAQAAHTAPGGRVLYATQGASDPPTFTLFANKEIPRTYLRYLERKIREHFELGPTPIKLRVRRRTS